MLISGVNDAASGTGSARASHTKGPWFKLQRGHRRDFGLSASAGVDPCVSIRLKKDATLFG